ncbi:MAG: hypothetical protein HAW62_01310 [Endozoicomonadaceae bacterium]|nr:hypothetical protein [Endozoicomonadaceae bacterium]
MTEFIIVASLLVSLVVLLLIIHLAPFKKNNSLSLCLVLIFLIPSCTWYLYQKWGNYDALSADFILKQKTWDNWPELLDKLDKGLRKQPSNYHAWYILGETWMKNGQYLEAIDAFNKVLIITNRAIEPLSKYTQACFLANQKYVNEEIEGLINEVLLHDPDHAAMLGIKGIGLFQHQQYALAIEVWEKMLRFSESTQQTFTIKSAIKKAKKRLEETSSSSHENNRLSPM